MPEDPNFLDLVCIMSITAETTLEKLGSIINASIFDASNIAGTLKQKALIEFSSFYPGPNTIVVTELGKKLIAEAEAKSTEEFDPLDETILVQIAGGKRYPNEVQTALNINPKDLALHLYKVSKQTFMSYELKSGNVNLLLSEKGFIKANQANPTAQMAGTPPQPTQPQKPQQQLNTNTPNPTPSIQIPGISKPTSPIPPSPETTPKDSKTPTELYGKPLHKKIPIIPIILIVVIIVAVIALYYINYG